MNCIPEVSPVRRQTGGYALKQQLANISASLADLGLILPLTLAMTLATGMNTGVVLTGLGLFALASGLIYRRPVPAQPMKVVAAMAIVEQINQHTVMATGIVMGVCLILLSLSGGTRQLRRWVSTTVLQGIQTALAISLLLTALPMITGSWLAVMLLWILFIGLKQTRLHALAFILVIVVSVAWFWQATLDTLSAAQLTIAIPLFEWPPLSAFTDSLYQVFFPQIALTLTNALLLVSVIAQDYYPEDKHRLTEDRFAMSSGVLNLLLAPFGAIPMCHGAGGLVAYHTAGGRNGVPVITLGLLLLTLGIVTGPAAANYLSMIPPASFGLLLLITATYLVDAKKLIAAKPTHLVIVSITVVCALLFSMLAGLIAGMLYEWLEPKLKSKFQ